MAGRRKPGEGSVYRRKGDGRWVAALPVKDAHGRSKPAIRYAATESAAEALLVRMREERAAERLTALPERITVSAFLARWLEHVEAHVEPTTFKRYRNVARLADEGLGGRRLLALSTEHVQAWIDGLKRAGRAASTVRLYARILHGALEVAVDWKLITENPAIRTRRPRADEKETVTLDAAQARALLAAAEGTRLEAIVACAVACGLRKGEVLGLRWSDVDLKRGAMRVAVQARHEPGGIRPGRPTKTRRVRTVMLPEPCRLALQAHRDRERAARRLGELVFTTEAGRPISHSTIHRQFKRLLTEAGQPDMTFHELRHSAASLLAAQGVHPSTAALILGHTTTAQTAAYTHPSDKMLREAADLMGTALASG